MCLTVLNAQETRTYWFNPSTLEAETEFMLVGLVLGLAIYNSVLLDFPLPIALYKKLVGQPPSLRDLSDMEPTVGKSLRELLNYSGARRFVCCSFDRVLTKPSHTSTPSHYSTGEVVDEMAAAAVIAQPYQITVCVIASNRD